MVPVGMLGEGGEVRGAVGVEEPVGLGCKVHEGVFEGRGRG